MATIPVVGGGWWAVVGGGFAWCFVLRYFFIFIFSFFLFCLRFFCAMSLNKALFVFFALACLYSIKNAKIFMKMLIYRVLSIFYIYIYIYIYKRKYLHLIYVLCYFLRFFILLKIFCFFLYCFRLFVGETEKIPNCQIC